MMRKFGLIVMMLLILMSTGSISFAAEYADITKEDIQEGLLDSKQFPVFLQVAGKVITPDVPPVIVKARTLVPVRAVLEGVGAKVIWNESAQQVDVTAGTSKVKLTIDSKTALVNGKQVSLEVPALIVEGRTMIPVRFVAEALGLRVGWDNATRTVKIDLPAAPSTNGLDVLDSRAAGKLVVIDAGHGGKDTGSRAIRNGVTVLNEKDINLDIALKLNNMLKAAGVKTLMTRDTDTFVDLYGRPELANKSGAVLFICIHNNSWTSSSANGTSVYYNSKESETGYGISSRQVAADVQAELIKLLGTKDRGIKSEPAYVVLNRTKMPAILIEGAFLSNDEELELMLTDQFRQDYAYAAAKAVIKNLNGSV